MRWGKALQASLRCAPAIRPKDGGRRLARRAEDEKKAKERDFDSYYLLASQFQLAESNANT